MYSGSFPWFRAASSAFGFSGTPWTSSGWAYSQSFIWEHIDEHIRGGARKRTGSRGAYGEWSSKLPNWPWIRLDPDGSLVLGLVDQSHLRTRSSNPAGRLGYRSDGCAFGVLSAHIQRGRSGQQYSCFGIWSIRCRPHRLWVNDHHDPPESYDDADGSIAPDAAVGPYRPASCDLSFPARCANEKVSPERGLSPASARRVRVLWRGDGDGSQDRLCTKRRSRKL